MKNDIHVLANALASLKVANIGFKKGELAPLAICEPVPDVLQVALMPSAKLSSPMTYCPERKSSSRRCEPIKPAQPVTHQRSCSCSSAGETYLNVVIVYATASRIHDRNQLV